MTDVSDENRFDQLPASHWAISKSAVAWIATSGAISMFAALVVVASVERADTLATIALTLAILAFIVQILIFLVQIAAANQQMLHAQRLYGETYGLLEKIRASSEGTQTSVDRIGDRLLSAALGKAFSEYGSTEERPTSDEVARRVIEELEQSQPRQEPAEERPSYSASGYRRRQSTRGDKSIRRRHSSWPTEAEAPQIIASLRALSPVDREVLATFAGDDYRSRRPGASLAPGLYRDPGNALRDAAYVRRAAPARESGGSDFHVLTPAGRELSRVFIAPGDPPDYLRDALEELGVIRIRDNPSIREDREEHDLAGDDTE